MEYVKGCDIYVLSRFNIKRIANGKTEIHESLKDVLSYEVLSDMLAEARKNFVDSYGKEIKDLPTAEVFIMTKKINKVKTIIGLSVIKRIAGEPSDKTGIARWFESSSTKAFEEKRFFAEGFEKEEAYFDHSMLDHFKNSVGSGQIKEAEYKDKLVTRVEGKKILGVFVSSTVIFIAMIILWGIIFKNFAIGLCFALCFTGSFAMITTRTQSEQKDLIKTENE